MNICLVTDAWQPQVNGVVRTLETVRGELEKAGDRVAVIAPHQFATIACPGYAEIRLAAFPFRKLARLIAEAAPDALHIATEGPLGWAARGWAMRRNLAFTTSFHTRFPDYLRARAPIPTAWSWAVMRRFHAPSRAVMVATRSLRQELEGRGFANVAPWTRGVDTALFRPRPKDAGEDMRGLPRPVFAYVGRVAVEKNIAAFLDLDLPGSKVVIGGGPQLAALSRRHPQVRFLGPRTGENLARHFAAADVFVFPSLTDTFGLVMLEALACGVPVAAFPVPGPADIVTPETGVLSQDLRAAALAALERSPAACRALAESYSWRRCADIFRGHLVPWTVR